MPATTAFAQQAPASGGDSAAAGDIVVTGTRIARPDLTVTSPVNVVSQQELNIRQPATAEDLLRDLPAMQPAVGPGSNNGANGSSTVDLRGMGSNRTLVLLDGRRLVPYGLNGVTDLNVIPTALLSRVDVVTGGASSVYGADAVAGVVNFITKRDFSGVEAHANYRITERGDTPQFRADVTLGGNFDEGRGNAVLSLGYMKRDALYAQDRPYGEKPLSSVNGQFQGSTNSAPIIFTGPNPIAMGITPDPTVGGAVLDPATGFLRTATQADTYNSNYLAYYQTPMSRYSLYGSARYEIDPAVEIYGMGMFNRTHTVTSISPSGTFLNAYNFSLNSPYIPDGVFSQFCTALAKTDPSLGGMPLGDCQASRNATGPDDPNYREIRAIGQRRFVEFGPRVNDIQTDQFQIELGARGDIAPELHYDIEAQYGETSVFQLYKGWGSNTRLQQALRNHLDPTTGDVVCNDPSGGCVPMNLFGPPGSITPEMVDFVNMDAQVRFLVKQAAVSANLSGDLFNITSPLADKPIAFSLSGDWRKITAITQPDANLAQQNEVLGTGSAITPDRGTINVKEISGEIIAPLVKDKPFFRNVQLEAGIRLSDYNTTGTSTTWKAGASWEPFEGFKFRGMYQVAVRSPNISELYSAQIQGLTTLTVDPCQGSLPVGNAGLTALCTATGAPPSTIGGIPGPSANQVSNTTGGNPNLDVEHARTYTLGVVLTPPQIRNLSITVDYFHIKLTGAIQRPSASDIINGCYSPANNPNYEYNSFCELIGRNQLTGGLTGAGDTKGVMLLLSNQGNIETAGIDFGVNYRLDLARLGLGEDPGSLSMNLQGTWLQYYRSQATPLAINRDCTGYYSTSCSPRPDWKWNARLTYSNGPADFSLRWRHISGMSIEPYQAKVTEPRSTPQHGGPNPSQVYDPYESVNAFDFFDLSTGFHVTKHLDLNLLVTNLFDKQPPAPAIPGLGLSLYDVLGRTYSMSATLRF